jgi:hypothetical protein
MQQYQEQFDQLANKFPANNELNINEDFAKLMGNNINQLFNLISVKNNKSDKKQEQKLEPELEPELELKLKPNDLVENIPIVLIDNSGSTSQVYANTKKSILKNEIDLLIKIMQEKQYSKCYLMFWNTDQTHKKEPIDITELDNYIGTNRIESTGGTDISVAIHAIPDIWYQQLTNIYIFTDGEVNSDIYKFSDQVFNLTKRKVNINIITIEANNYDYNDQNVEAGSIIYKNIQENKLSKYIRSFECYNCFHFQTPFVNFYNPEVKKGQFSFKEHVFAEEDFLKFTEIISTIIDYYHEDKSTLEKIIYHLSFTIYQYTRYKTQKIKNEIVKLFVGLFEDIYEDLDYIKDMFESEIKAHEEGVSKTFQQYKENRKKLFERTQDNLYSNVAECFAKSNKFISPPIKTTDPKLIKLIESNSMGSCVRLSDLYFNSGGIKYGDYLIPMFSLETKNYESADQALRQWVRAIYSRTHSIQISDEKILYLFLTDMTSIVLDDSIPSYIKSGYKNCSRVMLDSNRFNSGGIKQITWLTMGNKPKPMIPGYNTMEEILTYCANYFNPALKESISPDEFWYGICWAYGLEELKSKQIPHGYDIERLVETLKKSNKKYKLEQIELTDDLDYYDFITLEDTSDTGGYKFPDYKIGKKVFKSKFVISPDSYEFLKSESESTDGKTKCPITGNMVKLTLLEKVEPKNTTNNNIFADADFNMELFNTKKFEKVDIKKLDAMELKGLELKKSTDYDFTNYPYEFIPKVPIITEKLYKERVQYRTTGEFSNQISIRYDWLNKLDFSNIVIAGGFCKSIIFDEKVNDIDIYMYGPELESDTDYSNRLGKLVTDITKLISEKHEKSVSLQAYKKEFNVYELIYFENIKDLEKQNFQLEDLTQMKYICKIQIVMRKHTNKKDIFDSFDLDSSCVMWDGSDLLFNDRSYYAYKYMINIPRVDYFYTDIFDMRLLKYYNSGFRIVLPRLSVDKITSKLTEANTITINKSKFYVRSIENSNIYIDKSEAIVIKEKKDKSAKPMSIYNSIIGDLGSLNDSRSIVKFMRYVQRQNRIVERVRKNLEENINMGDAELLDVINDELKEELKDFGFKNKKYVKQDALLSDQDSDSDSDSDLDDKSNDDKSNDDKSKPKVLKHSKNLNDKNNYEKSEEESEESNNESDLSEELEESEESEESDQSDQSEQSEESEELEESDIELEEELELESKIKNTTSSNPILNTMIQLADEFFDEINGSESKSKLNPSQNPNIIIVDDTKTTFDKIDKKLFTNNNISNIDPNQNISQNDSYSQDNNKDDSQKVSQPEDYIKVYWKVCTPNSNYKINEFSNGNCDLKFIWEYDNYHKGFDWYNKDQELEQIQREKEELEQAQKEKLNKKNEESDKESGEESESDDEEIVVKITK